MSCAIEIAEATIVQQERENASLMTLPCEIRNQIWRLVIGDRGIHVNCEVLPCCSRLRGCDCPLVFKWTTALCNDPTTPKQLQDIFDAHNARTEMGCPLSPQNLFLSGNTCDKRYTHPKCDNRANTIGGINRHHEVNSCFRTTASSLLELCRQAHTETSYVLYNTNRFIFQDVSIFQHFMTFLPAHQRHHLSQLDLHLNFSHGTETVYLWETSRFENNPAFYWEKSKWETLFADDVLRDLKGLKSLHLYFREVPNPGDYLRKNKRLFDVHEAIEYFGRLRALPDLRSATVVVSCNTHNSWSQYYKSRFTQRQRLELSECFRGAILGDHFVRH